MVERSFPKSKTKWPPDILMSIMIVQQMKLENKIENWKTNKIVWNIGLKKWIRGRVGGVSFTQFFFECLDFFTFAMPIRPTLCFCGKIWD